VAVQRLSAVLYGVLKAVPSFGKTHVMAWVNPRALVPSYKQNKDQKSAASQIEPMSGLTFLAANLVLLSVIALVVFNHTPPFELPPALTPVSNLLVALPLNTIGTFVIATACWLFMPFCFLKLAGRAVTVPTLFRVLSYESALPTGATVAFFYLPLLMFTREEFASLRGYLIWPMIATGLFSYYWIARQLKLEGHSGGIAIYLGALAATAALFALQTAPIWPIHTYNMASRSMLPTLKAGDLVVGNQWAYFWRSPRRGEIAAYRGPKDPNIVWVSRVIGIPGDTIQIKHGILHINQIPIQRTRLPDFIIAQGTRMERRARQYEELLPWGHQPGSNRLTRKAIRSLDLSGTDGPLDNTPVYSVPEDHFFVVSDNRDNALDSRIMATIGFVPTDHFVGPVYRRLLPPTELDGQASTE